MSSWSPDAPTIEPATTERPDETATEDRYEYDVLRPPPWSTVTERRPATEPANVTEPAPALATAVPTGTAKSAPQCPA